MSVQDNALQFTYGEEGREGIASGQGRRASGRNPYLTEFAQQKSTGPVGTTRRGQDRNIGAGAIQCGQMGPRTAGLGAGNPAGRPARRAVGQGARPVEAETVRRGVCPMGGGASRQGVRPMELGTARQGVRPMGGGASRQGVRPMGSGTARQGVRPMGGGASRQGVRPMGSGTARQGVRPMESGTARQGGRLMEAGTVRRGPRPMEGGCVRHGARPMEGRAARRGPRSVEEPMYINRSGEGAGGQRRNSPVRNGQKSRSRGSAARRRRYALMQRAAIGFWVFCIVVLAAAFMFRENPASAATPNSQQESLPNVDNGAASRPPSNVTVQGLPSEDFNRHPQWTENFLTPNEFSRPGDSLESVTSIFVHYTANPGTSAAQNRSYFEQQKDTHENSVSAHFIIGYEGEIIQCVPLDEIAYAVMTRNFDSISIECCYLARDGSFTQETYDSLVSLLAWLIDVYDLDTEDILRHYDCGGKKCPLYYTNNPGEWEQLKKDVDNL